MKLSKTGIIANQCWLDIPNHFKNIRLDEFIVMPNHIHGIVVIDGFRRDAACGVSTMMNDTNKSNICNRKTTLGRIINSYKSAVTNICHKNEIEFKWQSRYYDHVVRTQQSLVRIRGYIRDNPEKWARDRNY